MELKRVWAGNRTDQQNKERRGSIRETGGVEEEKIGQSNRGKDGQEVGHSDRMRKRGAPSRTKWQRNRNDRGTKKETRTER